MSKLARIPVTIPKGVELKHADGVLYAKGPKGSLDLKISNEVTVKIENDQVSVDGKGSMLGTMHVLIKNLVHGVHTGFEKALRLVGVGYRAKVQGKTLELTLGFSHPVNFAIPDGVTIETPSNTDIIIKAMDKQLLGQVAANIREFRPPEPYKGKGVRYANEVVNLKETKKK